jgi:hypothetical protein
MVCVTTTARLEILHRQGLQVQRIRRHAQPACDSLSDGGDGPSIPTLHPVPDPSPHLDLFPPLALPSFPRDHHRRRSDLSTRRQAQGRSFQGYQLCGDEHERQHGRDCAGRVRQRGKYLECGGRCQCRQVGREVETTRSDHQR